MARNYGSGTEDVAAFLKPLLEAAPAQQALEILREDFFHERSLDPMGVALFANGVEDAAMQADVVGFISELIRVTAV